MRVIVGNQTCEVLLKEPKSIEILGIHHIDTVVSVEKLDNRTVVVSNCHIVVNNQRLELFNQATLEIATTRGLHGGINQTLAASHTMEIEVLRSQTTDESVSNIT